MKKFFATLYAKLTGGDTAPKTLEAARATFTEAKAALDRIDSFFSAAALDLDALLAKGDTALKDFITELNTKVTTAEAAVTEATGKVTTAEAKTVAAEGQVTALNSQLSAFTLLFASIGFTPKADAKVEELQTAFKVHVSAAVTQKSQEIGIPAGKLPKATTEDNDPKELSYEEFSKLSPGAKMNFCTSGGKLTDAPIRIGRN